MVTIQYNRLMAKRLVRSTSVFSSMTLLSRILGFARDMVVAHIFGASGLTDAFYVAFKIPNFMRRLFAEGAFSQAFVPVLAEYKTKQSHAVMQDFINKIAGTLAGILLVFTLIGIIAAPALISLFSPGFAPAGLRYDLATDMLRITFPYILFISLTAFASGVMNTHRHFAGPAITPILLNIAIIGCAILLAPYLAVPITALAWGVLIGGIVQLLFQIPFLTHLRVLPRLRWGWRDSGVQRVLKLMVPAIFGVSVVQIGLLVDTMFASFLPVGSISWLYNSERLMMFPLGVFGVAIATVILPHLAQKHAEKSAADYKHTLNWAVQSILLLGVPSLIGLIILSGPLLTTLFNYGRFSQFDVLMAQRSLIAYGCGVPFMMLIKVLASGFYAKQNIRTPVKVAIFALVVNIAFNFILFKPLQHAGLALAASISALVNSGTLLFLLLRAGTFEFSRDWWLFLLRLIIGCAVLGLVLWLFRHPQTDWFAWSWQQRFSHLLLTVSIAVLSYFIVLVLLGFRWKKR